MLRLFSFGGGSDSATPNNSRHSSSTPGNSRHGTGSSSSHSSYTVVSKDSESRGATPRTPGLAPNLASSVDFDQKSVITSTTVALDIPTLAASATISLDRADQQIKKHQPQLGASTDIEAHMKTLAEVRRILQKILIIRDLQTPPVLEALKTLNPHVEALEKTCTGVTGFTLDDLDKAMDGVSNAHQNLESSLPVDRNVVLDNKSHGVQVNAAMGGIPNQRRVYNEVKRNVVETSDGFQVNAPIYAGAEGMFTLLAARAAPVSKISDL